MLSSRARGRLTVMALGLLFLLSIGAAGIAWERWRNEPPAPCGAVPSERQLEWLRMEWYAFVHFGINTFTNREWGFGDEASSLFSPSTIDVDGTVRAFREAGMSGLIYTAKHHDGFCLWPTRSTQHNVAHSPWKNGQGDVVRLFADSCAKEGLKFGIYVSPWDRHHAEYGRAGYLVDFEQQVRELLTHYGEIFEIWFDGAQGGDGYYGGARENRCIESDAYYNFPHIINLVRQLQPNCIVWGADNLGDVRWGGSEKGCAPYPCVNVVNPDTPDEKWISWEADTTINRAGWFWHPDQQTSVKSPQELMDIYFASVGHGANLILNVALNRDGQADGADLASLAAFGEMRRKLLTEDYALGARATASSVRRQSRRYAAGNAVDGDEETYWCSAEEEALPVYLELRLSKPATFDVVRLREQIRLGQRVQAFRLEAWRDGAWKEIDGGGMSIGYRVMRRLAQPITTDRVRLVVTRSRACPCISEFSLLRTPGAVQHTSQASGSCDQPHDAYLSRKRWSSPAPDACAAWDGKEDTCWQSDAAPLIIDLGETRTFNGFACLPSQNDSSERLADHFCLEVSTDAQNWSIVSEGEFSNVRANPILQRIVFPSTVAARYVRLTGRSTQKSFITTVAEFYLLPPPMPSRSGAADNDVK